MNYLITVEPFMDQGQNRIRVNIPYHADAIKKIRSVEGREWNEAGNFWHIPYTKEAYNQLKGMFPHIEYEKGINRNNCNDKQNYEKPIFKKIQTGFGEVEVVAGNKVIVEQENEVWLRAYIPGDKKGWIEFIKTIPGRKWNAPGRNWLLPYVVQHIAELKNFFEELVHFNFQISEDIPERWTIAPKKTYRKNNVQLNEMQQLALTALEEKLLLENKRWRTIKSYKSALKGLLIFYNNVKPSSISEKQIEQYLLFQIKEKNISRSTQNQLISSWNIFFGKVLKQTEKIQELKRPQKLKTLPNVLTEEEVTRLLKSVDNLKHKCMLLLIYSAGLRKSEVLNLQVYHLNASNEDLRIEDAKGGKDRYTFYAPIAIRYLSQYLKMYQPKGWLFEGQTGGRYSETSLQKIFQRAKEKSKVNPQITIHGLRHSFATHLVNKGVPLHAVQQLLGHHSIKTTEIYLHISNQYRKQLQSPIEGLDI